MLKRLTIGSSILGYICWGATPLQPDAPIMVHDEKLSARNFIVMVLGRVNNGPDPGRVGNVNVPPSVGFMPAGTDSTRNSEQGKWQWLESQESKEKQLRIEIFTLC
jgi:hypothetical protein